MKIGIFLMSILLMGIACTATADPQSPVPVALADEWELVGEVVNEPGYHVWGCSPMQTDDGKVEASDGTNWILDSTTDWQQAAGKTENVKFEDGQFVPQADAADFESKLQRFNRKCAATTLTLTQSARWNTWKPTPKIGPKGVRNAPVFLPVGPGDYWFFAVFGEATPKGYHAFHSTNLKEWTHHGRVTPNWMTTAEYADGNFYLYYDNPNDQDPHLIVGRDLANPEKRTLTDHGCVFRDPSDGSDCGVLRDEDGSFHMVYEDWSPINARVHSWDSPLAGHTVSPDGIHGFKPHAFPAPVDERTEPTGKKATFKHVSGVCEYEIHEGEQHSYGDWTQIKVGGQYYLFGDFDAHDRSMRICCWTSDDNRKQYVWSGEIGADVHPDPTVGFAEGKFYLIVQRHKHDFVSNGPWVDAVEARVGIDTDNDGKTDRWTDWRKIRETYTQKPGFARVVSKAPAQLDLWDLPAGFGFQIAFRTKTQDGHRPVITKAELGFE